MNEILMVPDSRVDDRFYDNPLVTGEPYIIFYTGVPLISPAGFPLGTLCVIDNKPNSLDSNQISALKTLSKQVVVLIELRKNKQLLEDTHKQLEMKNIELEQFAHVAAHDLKSPLNSIISITDLINEDYSSNLDADVKTLFELINISTVRLSGLVSGILEHSKNERLLSESMVEVNLDLFFHEIIILLDPHREYHFILPPASGIITSNKLALEQIFINLISNGIKYNDKENIIIEIGFSQSDADYKFYIRDNGSGIKKEYQKRIFNIFDVEASEDRFGIRGNGIGLATVKKLVEGQGGQINVFSKLKEGSKFEFTIPK